MADLSTTACSRCREQKLRCSREQPECARCLKRGVICSYPSPPDRKSLAAIRGVSKKRPVEGADDKIEAQSLRSPPPVPSDNGSSTVAARQGRTRSDTETSASTLAEKLPSDAIQKVLVNVYFSCVFNSTLTFHQSTFMQALERKILPQHTLMAVSALATSFMTPRSSFGRLHVQELKSLGDLKALGRQWAISAGKEVLPSVDQPSLEMIQTCQTLSLYWFSRGDSQRNAMFSGISYRAIRCRLLNKKNKTPSSSWLAETERRLFWAAWIMNCVNSDHYVQGSSADRLALATKLPISEPSYQAGVQVVMPTLADSFDLSEAQPSDEAVASAPSLMAQLVKTVLIWARVRDQVEARNTHSPGDTLSRLFALDGELSKLTESLPSSLVYSRRNLYEQLVVNQQPVFAIIHAQHHQCRLVLYSSIVPQFSGMALTNITTPEVIKTAAQVALSSAKALSEIGADLLALEWDPSQVAAFFGYCMYAAASIHITLIFSSDRNVANEAYKNLTSSLKILKAMKPYWKVLGKLWSRICLLYEVQKTKASEDADSSDYPDEDRHTLDRVANVTRDPGRLVEPLKDSVLQYTLGQLQHDDPVDENSSASLELDRMTRHEHLTALMEESNSPSTISNPSMIDTIMQSNEGLSALSTGQAEQDLAAVEGDFMGANAALAPPWNSYDVSSNGYWQTDFGALPRGWFSSEEFFAQY